MATWLCCTLPRNCIVCGIRGRAGRDNEVTKDSICVQEVIALPTQCEGFPTHHCCPLHNPPWHQKRTQRVETCSRCGVARMRVVVQTHDNQ